MSIRNKPGWWKSGRYKKGTLHTAHIERYELLMDQINQFLWYNKGYVSNVDFVKFINRVESDFDWLKERVRDV